ncbi:MAG: inositol monophosphatase family protein [Acidimicrobiales bacterium]
MADLADAIALPRFGAGDLVVSTKPDLTPVSDADRSAERAIRRRLAEVRPDDAVIGEEFGASGSGARRWVLDPIDGTKNFVRGIPVWACLVALEEDGVPVLGVVSAPALHRRWWASLGGGAYRDSKAIRVSAVGALADAQLSYDSLVEFEELGWGEAAHELERRCWRARGFGDFWSHVLVAEGAVDVAAEPDVSLWDVAPLLVIVEEAGGRFSDLSGRRRADGGSALSTNGLLHDPVLGLFAAR